MKLLAPACLLGACLGAVAATGAHGAEILWDRYDVPHIYGDDAVDGFRAFGWAQMQLRGASIARLYGRARGRGAEYWGEPEYRTDVLVRRAGIPVAATRWLEALPREDRDRVDAFVDGMNTWAAEHPDALPKDLRRVLPLTSHDVLAHILRVVLLTYLAPWELGHARQAEAEAAAAAPQGSNAYAIAPSRSASGNAMLVINPHLSWRDEFLFIEAQLNLPSGSLYGVAGVGMPMLAIAFSEHGGWTHTVNQFDGSDIYRLRLEDDGYRFDDRIEPFETRTETIKVRQADGRMNVRTLTTRYSRHGPVVLEGAGGRAYALRLGPVDSPGMLRQYWDMGAARTLEAFESAVARQQMPFFNTIYANRDGHIFYSYNGRAPLRPSGDWAFWRQVIPGDRSAFVWDSATSLPYAEMPHFSDPPSGFIQNANEPPWSSTFPAQLDPADFPPWIAPDPSMDLRAQRSVRRVLADPSITFEELVALKQDTGIELADRVLDDLLAATATSADPVVRQAASLLGQWDRQALAQSRGAVLFLEWARRAAGDGRELYSERWDSARPLETPRGLADPGKAVANLKQAAEAIQARWGQLDVAWGEVFRLRRDGVDLPGSGGPHQYGAYRVIWGDEAETGPQRVMGGDTFVAVVEFGETVRAVGLLAYGNSDTDGADGNVEQLELFSRGELRPIRFYRADVERNTERRQQLD